jgi:hypothetical protein
VLSGIIGFTAIRDNNRTHPQFQLLFFIIVIDGPCGTYFFAVPAFALGQFDAILWVYSVFQWDGLGVFDVNGLSLSHAAVVFVGDLFRAFFGAGPAGNALVHVHVSRMLCQGDFKIALFAGYGVYLRQGVQLNIDVPADLDQFRRDNSHGTVVCRKRFIQLGHHTPD